MPPKHQISADLFTFTKERKIFPEAFFATVFTIYKIKEIFFQVDNKHKCNTFDSLNQLSS